MSIDSREKRQAVAALSGSHSFGPGITPNASKDVEWRQEAGYGYPGIAPSGAVVASVQTYRGFMKNISRFMNP